MTIQLFDGRQLEDNKAQTTLPVCNYTQISTNATTVVKSGSGVLVGIITTIIGTTSTVQVFDNTVASGQILVPSTVVTTALGAVITGIPAGIGVRFNTGLTVVTAGAVASTILVLWA